MRAAISGSSPTAVVAITDDSTRICPSLAPRYSIRNKAFPRSVLFDSKQGASDLYYIVWRQHMRRLQELIVDHCSVAALQIFNPPPALVPEYASMLCRGVAVVGQHDHVFGCSTERYRWAIERISFVGGEVDENRQSASCMATCHCFPVEESRVILDRQIDNDQRIEISVIRRWLRGRS